MKITIEFTSSENDAIINYLQKFTDVLKFLNNFSVLEKPELEQKPKIKKIKKKGISSFPVKSFTCEICTKTFERKARFARYCSGCRDNKLPLHKKKHKKEGKETRFKPKQFICVECEQVFEKTATTAKYCPKCKKDKSPEKKKESQEIVKKSSDNLFMHFTNGTLMDITKNPEKDNRNKFKDNVTQIKDKIINGKFTGKIKEKKSEKNEDKN